MAYDNAQIKNWWETNKVGQGGLTDVQVADAMDKFGVNASQVSAATGHDAKLIQDRYDLARNPKSPTGYQVPANQTGVAAKFTGYTPDKIEVDQDKSTVAGQLTGILRKGGPLMDRAETRGVQAANKRGLINSSMGIGAAEAALYDAAVPIATSDATTHYNAQTLNTTAENRSREYTTDWTNRQADLDATTDSNIRQNEATAKSNLELEKARLASDLARDAESNKQTRLNTAATNIAQINSSYDANVANILANTDMTVDQKNTLIDKLTVQRDNQIKVAGTFADVEVGPFLSTFTGNAAPTAAPATTAMAGAVTQANASSANEIEAINKAADYAEANNLTLAEVADQLKMSEADVKAKLAKADRTLPETKYEYDAKGGRRALG